MDMLANNDHMIAILLAMLPDVLTDYLLTKYVPNVTTFDEILIVMQDHLTKLDQRKSAKKSPKQVNKKDDEEEDKEDPFASMLDTEVSWTYDEAWKAWVCTTVPIAKRPRTEDSSTPSPSGPPTTLGGYTNDSSKGKSKGKGEKGGGSYKGQGGKGKGGPKGGCHECGGDHYAAQ